MTIYILLGLAIAAGFALLCGYFLGFSAQKPDHYKDEPVTFDIREHLNGEMVCEGVIYGPMGRVASRFSADFKATWEGNKGRMTESFRYDGGGSLEREWFLTTHNDGTFEAEASDLVGTGQGVQNGSAVQLKYNLRLPENAGGHVLNTVDWMYLLENGAIMNRSQMRKFGIKVAELVATIRRVPDAV